MGSSWGQMVAGASAALLFFLAADSGRRPAHAEDAAAGLVEKQVKSLGKVKGTPKLVVSPGGARLAYGDAFHVTCDGKLGRKYDTIYTDTIAFSPDGKRLVYGAGGAMAPGGSPYGKSWSTAEGTWSPAERRTSCVKFTASCWPC